MKLLHILTLSALALGFSGNLPPAPKPVAKKISRSAVEDKATDLIAWSSSRLKWDDFLCDPRRGTDAVASTSTSLGIAYQMINNKLSFHITCHFSKAKSWGLMKTDYILAHEQGHFDITEIFARRLNEALKDYQFNKKTFKKDIADIYQSIVDQKEAYQKTYDEETDHSRNRKMQYNWLETIQDELAETEPFAKYP